MSVSRWLACLVALTPAVASGQGARAVRVGLDGPGLDACGSFGQVTGLRRDGDNFLAVRAAPSTTARMRDSLTAGEGVFVCERSDDGAWLGVVWDNSGDVAECRVGSPVPRARPYAGPCASGWVSARFVKIVAG